LDENYNDLNDDDTVLDNVDVTSSNQKLRVLPCKHAPTQDAMSSKGQTDLQKENDSLRIKLWCMARGHTKMKQLINKEDEMVVMKLCRFVKN
jgi:hypothetical protein